jgi:hypothetical protein
MKNNRLLCALLFLLLATIAPAAARAETVTVSTFTINNWQYGGTTAKLRIYADKSFTTPEGTLVVRGTVGSTSFFREVSCTVSGTTLTVSTITALPTTTDGLDFNDAHYTFVLFDQNNTKRDTISVASGGTSFFVTHTHGSAAVITWTQLVVDNASPMQPLPPSFPTNDQMNAAISAAVSGGNPATTADQGTVQVDVAPADPAHPTAVGINSPLLTTSSITVSTTAGLPAAGTVGRLRKLSDGTRGVVVDTGSEWVELGGKVYNVRLFGATPDDLTDDTTAISAAVAAINTAGGGTLYFPRGRYKTTGGFTFTVPAYVRGDGNGSPLASDTAQTVVECSSATASLFTFNGLTGKVEHITLYNTNASPTAGAGVLASHVSSAEQVVSLDFTTVYGFYDDVDQRNGVLWSITHSIIHSPVRYGVRINNVHNIDAGDWFIGDNTFITTTRTSASGIRIEGSGGGKIVGVKVNGNTLNDPTQGFAYGIDAAPITSGSTSILIIGDTSVENVRSRGISIDSGWSLVTIDNIEFGIYGTSAIPLLMNGVTDSGFDNIVASTDSGGAQTAVYLSSCARIKLGSIQPRGFGDTVQIDTAYSESGYSGSNGWKTATLQNSWANFGAPYSNLQYRMEDNTVWVRGAVRSGTVGSTIFTLPLGFCPLATMLPPAFEFDGATSTMRWGIVGSDCTVKHSGSAATSNVVLNFSFKTR